MNYVFLAPGFEEIEAVTPIDVMRRGGMQVTTVAVTTDGNKAVTGAHGVTYTADTDIASVDLSAAEWLVLPGGMPGATNLHDCAKLTDALRAHAAKGGWLAAICASPAVVLGSLGLLAGRSATCYPGFENICDGAEMTGADVAVDSNIVTGNGPASALKWSLAILEAACGREMASAVADGMLCK